MDVGIELGEQKCNYQASPKFMAPMHNGLTLTAAEGESRRCLPRRDFGGGAGSIVFGGLVFYELYIKYTYNSRNV